ncbi:anti-repressor SinI family protein [Halobacillus sp. Marseille-Q1614]|nr:anti-repressor SinI family protein [Halobacillus sp. Marseille-Q1614]
MKSCANQTVLDTDWIEMIKEAKEMGLTVEEVRIFLAKTNKGYKRGIS